MVRHALGKRICLASATRKHKTFNKVVTRATFEEYDRIVLPKGQVAFWRKVETNIEVKDSGARTVLPGDVMIEVLTKTNYIFVIDFCLCITSSKCNDHPMDKGCIFLGNGVLKTPEDFGHIATRDETFRYIDGCSELAFVHIIRCNRLDSVRLNTVKESYQMAIRNRFNH